MKQLCRGVERRMLQSSLNRLYQPITYPIPVRFHMIVGKPAQTWKYPDVNLEQFFKVQIKILHPIQRKFHDRFLPTSELSIPQGQPPQIRRTPQHPQQRPERHPAIPHLDAGQPFAERTPPRANGDDLRTVQLEAGHRWRAAVHSESRVQRDSVWNVDANAVP
uniref:(northern house mosquito) hypothetical protein n=1 Tax=Culex pipiens TaxID=7175 RepID=A0A8D8A8M5_CULPI